MHCFLTTQSQNRYREQIQKETLTRLAWKSRYAKLYPSCYNPGKNSMEPTQMPQLPADPRCAASLTLKPAVGGVHVKLRLKSKTERLRRSNKTEGWERLGYLQDRWERLDLERHELEGRGNPDNKAVLPPVTRTPKRQSELPPPPPPPPPVEAEGRISVAPTMRPVSPQTRQALYQDSSHHGKGRSLYLQRRGLIRPEEKFDFPLLSSWEYGWRQGDYTLDYRTPSRARSSVVKNTFYARNGVFSSPSATNTLG
ncbi:uncharacterized protein LOC120807215 [Xiphias gladius]|uniref:uncharacterized protein LOC120807215 n=1 Tax=Xiphias gladius TaxID=8245 RepID=UPI001A99DCF2|nr:uncharacterized protein LOC120807215 [Xiphias gladius]